MIRVDEIRERIERSEYDVCPKAVAAAIVDRLTAGGSLKPEDESR